MSGTEQKGWAGPRPHHKKTSGHISPHVVSLGIPSRHSGFSTGLSLQIPTGSSPVKPVNASVDERGNSLERTKSLNELPKGQTDLLQEMYERGKEVQELTAQRDELKLKVAQMAEQTRQNAHEKDQTSEQLQEAILTSKSEMATLRHQLGFYESASREICAVLERGRLNKEDRVRVLNCIRSAAREVRDLHSSRSSPLLVLEDTAELEQLFRKVHRKDKTKVSGIKSPYRAPPASLMMLSKTHRSSAGMRRVKSPRALLSTARSLSPADRKSLDQQCEELYGRLKRTLEGWRLTYEKKQLL